MAAVDEAVLGWIHGAHESMEVGLRAVVLSPGMLVLGFVFVMQWFVLPFFPDASELFGDGRFRGIFHLQNMGLCIIVFQLYFVPHLRAFTLGSPFVASCLVVLYTNYILFFIKERFLYCVHGDEYKNHERRRGSCVTNIYMDISNDWSKVSLVFLVQLNLILYYVKALNDKMKRWEDHEKAISTWGLGVLVIVVAADDMGEAFAWRHWKTILELFLRVERHSSVGSGSRVVFRLVLFSRIGCDFIINSLSRSIILATAPLFLSMSSELQFILDVTAIAFIARLDDLDPPKSVKDMFEAFAEQHNLVLPPVEQHYQRLDGASRFAAAGEEGGAEDDLDLRSLFRGVK